MVFGEGKDRSLCGNQQMCLLPTQFSIPQYIYKYFKSLQAASHTLLQLVYPQLLFLPELSGKVHHPTAGQGYLDFFQTIVQKKSDQQAG